MIINTMKDTTTGTDKVSGTAPFKGMLIDLIYPPRCPSCDRVLPLGRTYGPCMICRQEGKPVRVHEPRCCICGKQLEKEEKAYCYDCTHKEHFHDGGRGIFLYREMEDAMWKFKNQNRREYAKFYGRELARELMGMQSYWNVQAMIPIPVHSSRMRERGYNQAGLIAREASRICGIPVDERLLGRCKKTAPQRELSDKEREGNLHGAFELKKQCCLGMPAATCDTYDTYDTYDTVVLIDDIYTTGSTINEAAKVLKAGGIRTVYFLTICIGKGY